jgi:hypothetical protein
MKSIVLVGSSTYRAEPRSVVVVFAPIDAQEEPSHFST